ncbi:MAG: aminoacyl-tRNA hydrolase [Coriobacteriaceae bacterium]|nr:aminoacyl-tRNA hydrolase [Coriobacteriaceae bacterium]
MFCKHDNRGKPEPNTRDSSERAVVLNGPRLIVGLGNPGDEYRDTRHNAGFKVIDALAEKLGVNYWKIRDGALIGEVTFQGEKLILAKPQQFMNRSGSPVKGLCSHYGLTAADLLVIHDELDLPPGTLRLKVGGGHAGHNGLRSLHEKIGDDYNRLRVGIGKPEGRQPAADYVLQRLKGAGLMDFEVSIQQAAPIAIYAIEEGMDAAMSRYNGL